MIYLLEGVLALIRFMLGAALFSFMNVVAWRLPRGQSVTKGRSACPGCGATLTALDLIPVFSWLGLRGRCRHCGAPIAPRYLLMELFGGTLSLLCGSRFGSAVALSEGLFGMSWAALVALAVMGILTAISLIDAETQIIPDRLNLALGLCAILMLLLVPEITPVQRLFGAVCISGPMLLLCLVIPGAFGGGDIKLMAAAGLLLGWQNTLVAAFLGVLGGGVYGAWLLAAKKAERKDHFAFGPFLCVGIGAAMLFGDAILHWYLQFF